MSNDNKNSSADFKIKVCCGNKCKDRMSQYTLDRACRELNFEEGTFDDGGITENGKVEVCKTGCMGKCREGVNVKIEKNTKKGKVEQTIGRVDAIKMGNLMNEFKKHKNKIIKNK